MPFLEERARFVTDLVRRGPAPVRGEPIRRTPALDVVEYRSGGRTLRGWLRLPGHRALARAGRLPLLVYLHGAYVVSRADLARCAPFVDAGFAVFAPAFRGEHDNPGDHELWLGELDDARAAIEHARGDPRFDPTRIAIWGHSGGGILSALLATSPDLDVLDTGSVNGLYDTWLFDHVAVLPFRDTPRERRMRVPAPHLAELAVPHLACVGADDLIAPHLPSLRERAARAPLETRLVPGDHYGAIEPGTAAFLGRLLAKLSR